LTSDDCDDNSYCLFSSNGSSDSGFCVPYVQEGGSCGGNIDSKYQKQCHSTCDCGYDTDGSGICQQKM
jgi:hypothetical protein